MPSSDDERVLKSENLANHKEDYRSPQLTVYGDLRQITMGHAMTGAESGGAGPTTKNG